MVALFALAALLFVGLAGLARHATPPAVEVEAARWVQQWANPVLTWFMLAVSWPGYPPQSYLFPVAVASAFGLAGRWREAYWVLGSQIAPAANSLLKLLIQRPRPSPELVRLYGTPDSPSFPSGHVVQFTALLGFVMFVVYVHAPASRWRTIALVCLGLLVVWVGLSRVYLGEHWPSDVLGGYATATLFLVPYCAAYSLTRPQKKR